MDRSRTGRDGTATGPVSPTPTPFARALEAVRAASLRPEVELDEVPAPTRLAPHALALSGDVVPSRRDDDPSIATGRFVLLHDPDAPEPWEGQWRIVTYAKAQMEPEVGGDPMAGEVGWSWLTDALEQRGLSFHAAAGTVTSVVSESFGQLEETPRSVELEVRASWSPEGDAIGGHVEAWGDLLCTIAGLPPLPEGVAALPGPRR